MNRHNVRNAAPLRCSWDDSESTIGNGPSEVVVDESNAVGIRENCFACGDRIEVVDRKTVDEIGIPVLFLSKVNSIEARVLIRRTE